MFWPAPCCPQLESDPGPDHSSQCWPCSSSPSHASCSPPAWPRSPRYQPTCSASSNWRHPRALMTSCTRSTSAGLQERWENCDQNVLDSNFMFKISELVLTLYQYQYNPLGHHYHNLFRLPALSTQQLPTALLLMDRFRLTHPPHSSHQASSSD